MCYRNFEDSFRKFLMKKDRIDIITSYAKIENVSTIKIL